MDVPYTIEEILQEQDAKANEERLLKKLKSDEKINPFLVDFQIQSHLSEEVRKGLMFTNMDEMKRQTLAEARRKS